MNRWIQWWSILIVSAVGLLGCVVGDEDASEDTGDPWDDTDTEDAGTSDIDYVCLDDSKPVDEVECGAYPEHDNEMWDLYAVVPNGKFKAFYDRDCDGEPEETVMDMYADVYCQRDKVKSLVLVVGSNCGSGDTS